MNLKWKVPWQESNVPQMLTKDDTKVEAKVNNKVKPNVDTKLKPRLIPKSKLRSILVCVCATYKKCKKYKVVVIRGRRNIRRRLWIVGGTILHGNCDSWEEQIKARTAICGRNNIKRVLWFEGGTVRYKAGTHVIRGRSNIKRVLWFEGRTV